MGKMAPQCHTWSPDLVPQPLARYNSFCGPMAEHPWGLGATPTGPSHRHLFYGEQTHFGLNFLQLLSLRQTHLLQVLGSLRLSLPPSPNHACWQQFPGIHSFHTAVETLCAESGGQELSHNTAGPNEPSVLPMQVPRHTHSSSGPPTTHKPLPACLHDNTCAHINRGMHAQQALFAQRV